MAFEVAPAEMTFGLHAPDEGVNGGTTPQLALHETEDAALLAGDEVATGILHVVAAVAFADIGPLDRRAGECVGAAYGASQGVTVVRIVGHRSEVAQRLMMMSGSAPHVCKGMRTGRRRPIDRGRHNYRPSGTSPAGREPGLKLAKEVHTSFGRSQSNELPSTQTQCRTTATLHAMATFAFLVPIPWQASFPRL